MESNFPSKAANKCSKIFLYTFILPINALLLDVLELVLAWKGRLTPFLMVKWKVLLFIGWMTQTSLWFSCESDSSFGEFHRSNSSRFCPSLVVSSHHKAIGTAKWCAGLSITILICCHLGLAVLETMLGRKSERRSRDTPRRLSTEERWAEKAA